MLALLQLFPLQVLLLSNSGSLCRKHRAHQPRIEIVHAEVIVAGAEHVRFMCARMHSGSSIDTGGGGMDVGAAEQHVQLPRNGTNGPGGLSSRHGPAIMCPYHRRSCPTLCSTPRCCCSGIVRATTPGVTTPTLTRANRAHIAAVENSARAARAAATATARRTPTRAHSFTPNDAERRLVQSRCE